MYKHTAEDFEVGRTKADIMRRIGVLSDAVLVCNDLWKGCPGDDKSLPAVIRYHHGTHNSLASIERRVGVQDYITRRIQSSLDHHEMVQRGILVQQDAEEEIAVLRHQMRSARS